MFKQMIKKSIHKSQHCNRNWDLSKSIPQEDIDLIVESATQCPVKQNLNYYKTHIITDRDKIEKIHDNTVIYETKQTNSQTLANILLAFTKDQPDLRREQSEVDLGDDAPTYTQDREQALGIAVGYVNLVSSMLGYETGCCKCFDGEEVSKLIGKEYGEPLLLMGIGYPDPTRNRLEHHKQPSGYRFHSFPNQREVVYH